MYTSILFKILGIIIRFFTIGVIIGTLCFIFVLPILVITGEKRPLNKINRTLDYLVFDAEYFGYESE